MNTSELQTKYYLETSRESVDEKGDFTDHYVAWLQDIIIGRNKVKNLAQPDVSSSNCHHEKLSHIHHVGSYFEPKYGAVYDMCENCGEKLNLVEYGNSDGRMKWW